MTNMSQKLGFPYMGLKINTMIFFIGIILSALSYIFAVLYSAGYLPLVLLAFVRFLGVFLTGWALLGYAVMKEVLAKQRLIAFLFAIVLLTTLFTVSVTFTWIVL
jgi:hypothetical protein